jgi:beta-lactamase class A
MAIMYSPPPRGQYPITQTCRAAATVLIWLMMALAICAFRTARGREPEPKLATPTLESRIMPLIRAHKGKVAVAVKHLVNGEAFVHNSSEVMPTASLIKFPVMIEAYRQAAAKQIDLDTVVVLRKRDMVPGSGVLTYHFTDGSTFRLRDAVRLMIAFSDNTATNLVLDAVGIGATAATMDKLGYSNTKIHSKVFRRETSVFPERSKQFGLGSTTADEMIRLCQALYRKELVSAGACDEMIEHLRACEDKDKFPRFLPPGVKVAFKTGSLDNTRTAAGIIEWPNGPVAVCVLSCDNEDKRWVADNAGNRLCAEIARAVVDHFDQTSPVATENRGANLRGGRTRAENAAPTRSVDPRPKAVLLSEHLRQSLRLPVAVDAGQR